MSAIVTIRLVMEPSEDGAFDFEDDEISLRMKIETEMTLIGAEHESIFAHVRDIEVDVER
jgi:hypothetical protein